MKQYVRAVELTKKMDPNDLFHHEAMLLVGELISDLDENDTHIKVLEKIIDDNAKRFNAVVDEKDKEIEIKEKAIIGMSIEHEKEIDRLKHISEGKSITIYLKNKLIDELKERIITLVTQRDSLEVGWKGMEKEIDRLKHVSEGKSITIYLKNKLIDELEKERNARFTIEEIEKAYDKLRISKWFFFPTLKKELLKSKETDDPVMGLVNDLNEVTDTLQEVLKEKKDSD